MRRGCKGIYAFGNLTMLNGNANKHHLMSYQFRKANRDDNQLMVDVCLPEAQRIYHTSVQSLYTFYLDVDDTLH